jgi:hypothetical protein
MRSPSTGMSPAWLRAGDGRSRDRLPRRDRTLLSRPLVLAVQEQDPACRRRRWRWRPYPPPPRCDAATDWEVAVEGVGARAGGVRPGFVPFDFYGWSTGSRVREGRERRAAVVRAARAARPSRPEPRRAHALHADPCVQPPAACVSMVRAVLRGQPVGGARGPWGRRRRGGGRSRKGGAEGGASGRLALLVVAKSVGTGSRLGRGRTLGRGGREQGK